MKQNGILVLTYANAALLDEIKSMDAKSQKAIHVMTTADEKVINDWVHNNRPDHIVYDRDYFTGDLHRVLMYTVGVYDMPTTFFSIKSTHKRGGIITIQSFADFVQEQLKH